jgi:tryptophan halogenase
VRRHCSGDAGASSCHQPIHPQPGEALPRPLRFDPHRRKIGRKKFHDVAQPTWKLGLKFLNWGPGPHFFYTFGSQQPDASRDGLAKPIGYYCNDGDDDAGMVYDLHGALMARERIFVRADGGAPRLHDSVAYHFENEMFVRFLEGYASATGVQVMDDTVSAVTQDDRGMAGLQLVSGATAQADLYVDCSGFTSLLLGRTLAEPFISFKDSLFCDRAVAGGWDRRDEVIRPYTTCQTMNAGWCWQIEHEHRINRGYVYCSSFISDADAESEFRQANPQVGPTRVVRFVSGCYRRAWAKNVVAVGNAAGFVEPLEATALGVIAMQSRLLADTLADCDRTIRPTQVGQYNRFHERTWEGIRDFISVHYRFNTHRDTPFWRHCREHTDLAGAAPLVEFFKENGPSGLWRPTMLDSFDPFGTGGYATLLLGQKVPYQRTHEPSAEEIETWRRLRQGWDQAAAKAMTVKEALEVVRSPRWKWA